VALASPRTKHAAVVAWAESQPDTPKMLERIRQEGR